MKRKKIDWDSAISLLEDHWETGDDAMANAIRALKAGKRLKKKCQKLNQQVKDFNLWKANLERLDIKCKGSGMGWCMWIRKGDASGVAQLFNGDIVYIEMGEVCRGEKRVKVG